MATTLEIATLGRLATIGQIRSVSGTHADPEGSSGSCGARLPSATDQHPRRSRCRSPILGKRRATDQTRPFALRVLPPQVGFEPTTLPPPGYVLRPSPASSRALKTPRSRPGAYSIRSSQQLTL